jgi:hypothetical protein
MLFFNFQMKIIGGLAIQIYWCSACGRAPIFLVQPICNSSKGQFSLLWRLYGISRFKILPVSIPFLMRGWRLSYGTFAAMDSTGLRRENIVSILVHVTGSPRVQFSVAALKGCDIAK